VHALYGFARYADEIVDDLSSTLTDEQKAQWLREWGEAFLADVARGHSDDPVCRAVVDTVLRWEIPLEFFTAFLHSMTMDLTVTEYRTFDDLYEYVYGSAAVIGLQMVPILGPTEPAAYDRAKDLGVAFQLANFIRDVNEDLDRNRVYLPADELAAFGVDRELLMWCHDNQRTDPRVRQALAAQHDTTRAIYREAHKGIALLAPQSRPCVTAAFTLYSEILDRIEDIDYAVFSQRASVGMGRRIQVFTGGLVRARRARRLSAA
jgi:phytoene synthase